MKRGAEATTTIATIACGSLRATLMALAAFEVADPLMKGRMSNTRHQSGI